MPSDSAGWHTAAQICWLYAWGLAFGMIHGFRDNKSLKWSSSSFHRVHYHFIYTEEPKHVSPWPSGSLSQALRDPADPQRWQLQIAGATVWIITCSCLFHDDHKTIQKSQGRQPRLQMSNRLCYLWGKHTSVISGVSMVSSHQGRRRTWLSGWRGPLAFNLTSAMEGASWLVVLGIFSMHRLKSPTVNGSELFLAKGLFIPQEENIGNSQLKYFSSMQTDPFLPIPPSKWEFYLRQISSRTWIDLGNVTENLHQPLLLLNLSLHSLYCPYLTLCPNMSKCWARCSMPCSSVPALWRWKGSLSSK